MSTFTLAAHCLVGRAEDLDLGDEGVDDVVLLDALGDEFVDLVVELRDRGIEDLFFDLRVDLELLEDRGGQPGGLGVVLALGRLEAGEQPAHPVVVSRQQFQRVHQAP